MTSRRTKLPAPSVSSDLNLFNLLKQNVGKDLSKVSFFFLISSNSKFPSQKKKKDFDASCIK